MGHKSFYILLITLIMLLNSCVSRNIIRYYNENKNTLDNIEELYKEQDLQRHFTIEFTDKYFDHVSVEIWTDSLKYIYEFSLTDHHLNDTVAKYHLNVSSINQLIRDMKSIHCTWVNNLDYYLKKQRKTMVFISIRPRSLNLFSRKKYYILSYFNAPQYYDKEGSLMVNRRLRKVRKINADVFHRINDKVAYTISDRFR